MGLPRKAMLNINFPSQSRDVTETLSYIALGLLARENLFNYLPQLYLLSGMIIKPVSLFHSFSIQFKYMPKEMQDIAPTGVDSSKPSSQQVSRVLLPRAQPNLCSLMWNWKVLRCSANPVTECSLSSFNRIIIQFMRKGRECLVFSFFSCRRIIWVLSSEVQRHDKATNLCWSTL